MKSLAKSEFEAWADTYDGSPLHRFMFRPSYLMLLEEVCTWVAGRREPFRVLDIGCGTGTFDGMLAASMPNARVVGLDYAPNMARVAAGKVRQAGLADRVQYTAGDSEHLPFADGSFDVVTCSNSFHHYPHQQAVVSDMRRVLRPDGRLLLIDGFRDNVVGWVIFDVIIASVEKQVFHAPWSTIHTYFEQAGFRQIRRRKFNLFFPLLLTVGEV